MSSGNGIQKSIRQTMRLLDSIIQDPSVCTGMVEVLPALRSQGGLAKLSIPEQGIYPMSLNTMKKKCEFLPCGFESLDDVRKAALKSVTKAPNKKKEVELSVRKIIESKSELKQKNTKLQRHIMWLVAVNVELRALCFELVKGKRNPDEYCRRIFAELSVKEKALREIYPLE